MRLLIYSMLSLLAAVGIAAWLAHGGGQIIVVLPDYSIRTSLGMFVFLLLAVFAVLYVAVRSFSGLMHIPDQFRSRRSRGQNAKAEFYLTRGFIALEEGDWQEAEKLFKRGTRFSRWPAINYIGAARAAQQQGALDRRDAFLDQAHSASAESALAADIVRTELQLEQQQTDQAYLTLKQMNSDTPGNPKIRAMLLEVASVLKDWRQMLELLNEYERTGGMTAVDLYAGQLQAGTGLLREAARRGDLTALNTVWHNLPARLRKEPLVTAAYVQGRLQYADTADCEPLIREALREELDPDLIRLYGLVQGKDTRKQLALVEKLLASHPDDATLLLTAGRLYKRSQLWGKARHNLETSLKYSPSAAACHELATMFDSQGDAENANRYFREGLKLATKNLVAG